MSQRLWSVVGEGLIGLGFVAYGLARKPLDFNEFNPRKAPLSVQGARLLYIPIGVLFIFFSIRDFIVLHQTR